MKVKSIFLASPAIQTHFWNRLDMGKYGLSDGLVRDWEKQVFMKTWSCGQKARVDMGWYGFKMGGIQVQEKSKNKRKRMFLKLSSKPEGFGRNTIFLCWQFGFTRDLTQPFKSKGIISIYIYIILYLYGLKGYVMSSDMSKE